MKNAKNLAALALCLVSIQKSFAHGDHGAGGDTLEEEFSSLSHVHFPMSFAPGGELSVGYHLSVGGDFRALTLELGSPHVHL